MNSQIDLTILSNIVDLLFFLDFISEVSGGYFHIPVGKYGVDKVEVTDIRSDECRSFLSVGVNALEQMFVPRSETAGELETLVLQPIITYRQSHAILLRLEMSSVKYEARVSDFHTL